jgi:hyperosmotically inducible protein
MRIAWGWSLRRHLDQEIGMMSRFIALLCLSAVGCSHDALPAQTGDFAGEQVGSVEPTAPSNDPNLQPASLENRPERRNETASVQQPAPAPASRSTERTTSPKEPTSTMAEPASPPSNAAPADNTLQPDNTKVNERDRSSAALTPTDQGNGETDLKLTQAIRQAVMADKALSFTAKNIKIIAKDGKVTLRGPVKTAEERAAIEADARKAAGNAPIDNQIEVKK